VPLGGYKIERLRARARARGLQRVEQRKTTVRRSL
jgi:hypothetical protein